MIKGGYDTFSIGNDKMAVIFERDAIGLPIQPSSLIKGKPNIEYVAWGIENDYPDKLIEEIGKDEVLAPNKFFNIQACYGAGVVYRDSKTKQTTKDKDIQRFLRRNNLARLELERITDMKYFFFDVVVVILSNDRKKIVSIRHKEASNIRFQKPKNGKIEHVYYGDWTKNKTSHKDIEIIPLLDQWNPIGDLMEKMGREPGDDGLKKRRTNDTKFAILTKFPTPGDRIYPDPYSSAFLRSVWYDIKKLIPEGKKAKMKNSASIKYLVEINRGYWENLYRENNITDPEEKKAAYLKKRNEIREFIAGMDNSGKMWFSSFLVDPTGREISDVKITVVNQTKEGGDWSEDAEEANNMACYSDGVHPNLVGATPGKSKMNNSGSDKRELFNMKQQMEKPFHDIMAMPHYLVCEYNGWDDIEVVHPIITMTTLDKGKEIEIKDPNELKGANDDDM